MAKTSHRVGFGAIYFSTILLVFFFLAPCARAQLVNDGATNTLDNVTNTVVVGGAFAAVGTNAPGTLLVLTNGTLLTTSGGEIFIGANEAAKSSAAWVTGSGTRWLMNNNFKVGVNGTSSLLVISNGGQVVSQGNSSSIGYQGSNDSVVVTGVNSVWSNVFLWIGYFGHSNSLIVSDGGTVLANTSSFGGGGSMSNYALVTGAGSVFSTAAELRVGDYGDGSTLVISNGGFVYSSIGSFGGSFSCGGVCANSSSSNLVVVDGMGSEWAANRLSIGLAGRDNQMRLTNGGTIRVLSSGLFLGEFNYPGPFFPHSNTLLRIDGGTVLVTNAAGTNVYDLRHGTNLLNSGLVDVDQLVMTNNLGFFQFNGGTLRTKGTVSSNGQPFVVGNGASAASLQLLSGTHVFANGLLVQGGASLQGTAVIVGNVTNFGGLAPGNSAGALAIEGSLSLRPGANLAFEIGGVIATNNYDVLNVTGTVEFAGTLSVALINGFLPKPTDQFTLVSFGSSTGSFANIAGGRINLANNLASFAVTQTTTNLVIGDVVYVDTDGDGQGDLQEQAAGTDPNDPNSNLHILAIAQNGSGHNVITFQSVPAKTYRIEYSPNLATWAIATTNVPSAGATTTWTDDGSQTGGLNFLITNRFYRVGLQ